MAEDPRPPDAPDTPRTHSGVPPAPPQGLIGSIVDRRYRVEALLGEGGMGLVYRVRHTQLNKALAIKVLRRENTHDPEVVARFRREAESASGIGNQHIVDINDFGVLADGSTYFVMECLEGMDLIDAMDRVQYIDEVRALHISEQVCKALGAAHEAGIVHRDLKPENVFLTRQNGIEDFVKVLDFGIAKVANGPKRLTRQGEVLGTPHYMSPEQCEGDNVDHRTDIYALGVLLYEMVTGHVPHDAENMAGILTKHIYEEPIPPKVRAPHVSDAVNELILRCLEKKPEQRYQTMRDLEADLERVRSGARPVGPETLILTPTRPPSAPQPRRRTALVAGLVVGALALVAVALILATRPGPAAPEAPLPSVESSVDPETIGDPVVERPSDVDAPREPVEGNPEAEPTAAEASEPKSSRPKAGRRKPKKRSEGAERGTTVILDPWK
jgi:serine/threonine-protein kinase